MITPQEIKEESPELYEQRLKKEEMDRLESKIDFELKQKSQFINSGFKVPVIVYDTGLVYQIKKQYEIAGWKVEIDDCVVHGFCIIKFSL